jgi:hypothetical protein
MTGLVGPLRWIAQDQISLAATRVVTVEHAALRDSSNQTVRRSVIRVISLGAKTRNGGPQKPVPRLV